MMDRLFWIILLIIMPSRLIAQKTKQQLTEADYRLWCTMSTDQLSDAGHWVSYSLHYEAGNDTLFVKNTRNLKTISFPEGSNGKFLGERYFVCQNSANQLLLLNLQRGGKEVIQDVSSYGINGRGTQLIVHHTTEAGGKLIIKDLEYKNDIVIPNVSLYSYNEKANSVVYSLDNKLLLLNLTTAVTSTIMEGSEKSTFSDFTWQQNGESIAYFITDSKIDLGLYKIKTEENFVFNSESYANYPKDSVIINSSFTQLTISADGTMVFFGLKPDDIAELNNGVQIWNSGDKSLYPEKSTIKNFSVIPKVGVWDIPSNTFSVLTDDILPQVMLTGDQKNAILWNPLGTEPQPQRDAPIDFYLLNIKSGSKELLLSEQSPDNSKLSVSGTGRYIVYYKGNDWWVYDIAEREHRNLTSLIGKSFEDENYNRSGERKTAGIAGWTEDDSALLIYDTYDVWLIKTDGSGYKKLTDGRERKISFRVVPQTLVNQLFTNFGWNQLGTYALDEGLLLKATADFETGYFRWTRSKGLLEIVSTANRISNLKLSKGKDVCVYTEEHFHLAPRIMMRMNSKKPSIVYKSNKHQNNYKWGFSKLITFENSQHELLKGALFYPADYNPERSYPMVVHIYELQAGQYNRYVNPTVYNYDGFNITNFTSQGYFVLLPDIKKVEGNPGRSALDCVTAAVEEVMMHEPINPKQIGLLGHSFGAYQTNFIITQTNLFAAAVSGSGISDIVSDYLYVSGNTLKANGWRYEFDQASIGISLFDDYQTYLKNSPISYAKQIKTPLLLWTGDHDKTVSPSQSMELYLALRRMQKKCIMLLYEGNSHSLGKRNHQRDLTIKMREWFDFYLNHNGGKKPDWFLPNRL